MSNLQDIENRTSDYDKCYSIGDSATLACLLEAAAPKIGNVHRGADFADLTFYDFIVSAVSIKKIFDRVKQLSIGEIVLQSVKTTQMAVGTNTNLGIILLLAPLAKSIQNGLSAEDLSDQVKKILATTTNNDCHLVYQAIRLSKAGSMGSVGVADVNQSSHENPGMTLVEAMKLAQGRDSIARQYSNGFKEFFATVYPIIQETMAAINSLPDAIVLSHLKIMSEIPDTLIARKCGEEIARQCSTRARRIVNETEIGSPEYWSAVKEFDFWLRSDRHQRNPGTSADFVAAGLFVCLATGNIDAASIRTSLVATRNIQAASI